MSLYNRMCDHCRMMTTHESGRGDPEDFTSVYEVRDKRVIFCRLCERGNSPEDTELDGKIVDDVLSEYPTVAEEALSGRRESQKFIRNKIYKRHKGKYSNHRDPKALRRLLIDHLEWDDSGLKTP